MFRILAKAYALNARVLNVVVQSLSHRVRQPLRLPFTAGQRWRRSITRASPGPYSGEDTDTAIMPSKRSTRRMASADLAGEVNGLSNSDLPADTTVDPTTPKKRKRPSLKEASPHISGRLGELLPKATAIADQLGKLYPKPPIPLHHNSGFQLLCAVVLSAQTTDKKVNEVTPKLFRLAPDAASMAKLPVETIAECIKTLGLAPTKAKNLRALSVVLDTEFGGKVPESFEGLEALPGVGHKTASVVMAQVHGLDAFPVDTHIHRLAQRWGLTTGHSVEQTEADLKLLFPSHLWRELHLQIIYFGRDKCPAKGHDPEICPICCWAAIAPYDRAGNSPAKAGKRMKTDNGPKTAVRGKKRIVIDN